MKYIFYVDKKAYEGLKLVVEKVAGDFLLVTGVKPEIAALDDEKQFAESLNANKDNQKVVFGTLKNSCLLSALSEENSTLKETLFNIEGKREVFALGKAKMSSSEVFYVAGSDKLGSIFGAFTLSEKIGVSPLIYWGDCLPSKNELLDLSEVIKENFVSKEPSVRYRGFFINDEWPAFGGFCNEQHGGFNTKTYDHVFELLLRLKGNYMWPAMWTSIFSEDGPGIENAKLADTYGITMGTSHHEPCCRAGEEWQKIYKQYGDDSTWSYLSNGEAITKFWEDGLLRNKNFANVITIGMRGEADSKLLPVNATLKDNIDVLKKVVLKQHELIRKHINEDLTKVPRMLAIYKEVEDYYYGDKDCEGLREWKELDDVIFLLSDDNFGNTRGLPEKSDKHKGGYGMYYHFDYHGGPISYEWQNTVRLTKTWEQLTLAYEYGVRDMWIVNVGDLKGAEYPLSYFCDLAYDFEKWSKKNKIEEYVREWLGKQFGARITETQTDELMKLTEGYTRYSSNYHPETTNQSTFNVESGECEKVLFEVNELMNLAKKLDNELEESCLNGYRSVIYYPSIAILNVMKMNALSALNAYYAKKGSLRANYYGKLVKESINCDKEIVKAYHAFNGGKWNHMMQSAHTGFKTWDAYDWSYPQITEVVPLNEAKIVCGFKYAKEKALGTHWQYPRPLKKSLCVSENSQNVIVELDSRGENEFNYKVKGYEDFITIKNAEGFVGLKDGICGTDIEISVDTDSKNAGKSSLILIEITFDNGAKTEVKLEIKLDGVEKSVIIPSYCGKALKEEAEDKIEAINYLGREGKAVKAFPVTKTWNVENAPRLSYEFVTEADGEYLFKTYLIPRNPVVKGGKMQFGIDIKGEKTHILDAVSANYYTEHHNPEWSMGVLKNLRVVEFSVRLTKGKHEFDFFVLDPGVIVEKFEVGAKQV
ncbi:MAG: glycosyl hydrolase 115 family protein [Lachnospiraceae bacterium]|nr:glycosyl hydrolase 115 family protein [Lachnospiraceae bacterium]